MKHEDEIDKLFRDKLGEIDVPEIPQAYLDDINQRLDHLPRQKKRRRGGFFWGFSLIILSSFGIYYSFFHASDKTNTLNAENNTSADPVFESSETNTDQDQAKGQTLNHEKPAGGNAFTDTIAGIESKADEHDALVNNRSKDMEAENNNEALHGRNEAGTEMRTEEKSTATASFLASVPKKNSLGKENASASLEAKSTFSKDNIIINTSTIQKEKSTLVANTQNQEKINAKEEETALESEKNNIALNNKEAKNNEVQKTDVKAPDKEKLKEVIPSTPIDDETSKDLKGVSKADTSGSSNETIKSLSKDSIPPSESITGIASIDSLATATKDSITLIASDSSTLVEKDSVQQPVTDSTAGDITKNKEEQIINNFTLQATLSTYQIVSTFGKANDAYNNKRKEEESAVWMYDANVHLNYNIRRLNFSAGINYSEWGEKISYTPTIDSVSYLSGYDTTYTTLPTDSNNFITNAYLAGKYENKPTTNNALTEHNGINKYSYINIPLQVGYMIGNADFSVTPKIGAMVGIPIKAKGYYINTDVTALVEEKSVKYLFNYQVSLDLKYQRFSVIPFYRKNISPLVKTSNTNNTYSGWGVQFGYTIDLK